jgi:transposase InsO family protein
MSTGSASTPATGSGSTGASNTTSGSTSTPATSSTPTSAANTTSGTTPASVNAHSAAGAGGDVIVERHIADQSWPSSLVLNLADSNWHEWSRRLVLLADRSYVSDYLDGSLACPDPVTHKAAHQIWKRTDRSLRAFILERVFSDEYDATSNFDTAHQVFEALRTRHEKLGLHAQINLLRKAFEICYEPGTPMNSTSRELRTVHDRIVKMGAFDNDKLLTVLLVNSLGRNYPQLQSTVHGMVDDPSFTSATGFKRVDTEASLELRRAELSIQSPSTALTAVNSKGKEFVCTHCKRPFHTAEFCIQKGGRMAGRSLEDAKAASRAAVAERRAKAESKNGTHTALVAITPGAAATNAGASLPPVPATAVSVPTAFTSPLMFNGVPYALTPISAASATLTPHTANLCDHTGTPLEVNDLVEYRAFITVNDASRTSLNWEDFSKAVELAGISAYPISTSSSHPPACVAPFILDSGATCHISPNHADFKRLSPIPPHPVKGLGSTCVYAIGMGDIELSLDTNHRVVLRNALFIPSSTVRLISVLSINRDDGYFCHFGSDNCWITDKDGATIARGTVSPTRQLFILSTPSSPVPGTAPSSNSVCHLATRTPDLETWHRRLGHCSVQTIIDMAQNKTAKGMPIDLSTAPAKCDNCILGKQTRSSVPKMREGVRATVRLGRVFVDLCGPMSVSSKTGRLYAMNIIDDFSSYVWTVPLKTKDEAAHALQVWHRVVENQCGDRLKILTTDNGELLSNHVTEWCANAGIVHQLTAPYTSAHNGRAERLHRTLLDKARTMRLACNAPASLWDEFCATAAYLTNLTASSSLKGKTPFELWYGFVPSLTHLREIGCRAFALIMTHNPKILQRSVPCVLIGYAPNAKAYRLWNPASGRVFNSFHINFIEHLDAQPSDLLPGTLINVDDHSIPPSWQAVDSGIATPSFIQSPEFINPTNPSLVPEQPSATLNLPIPSPSQTPPNPSPHPSITITPPSPPSNAIPTPSVPLRRSARIPLLALRRAEAGSEHAHALLSEFSRFRDTHHLIAADLNLADINLSIDEVLSAISDGSIEPLVDSGDDPTWAEALASPDREYWIAGGREELKSLEDLKVFVLVPRSEIPRGQRLLKGKLVCKRKRDDQGRVVRYKVRYVAKGYAQRYGIDYDKTTSPTARLESFRTILHIAAALGWDLQQIDIKTAFLHGVLPEEETMYMEQPPGFELPGKEDWAMKLTKSIYGMKQASRVWNQTFHKAVESWGFKRMPCEWCVYRRQSSSGTIIFAVHVDDIVSAASSPAENDAFKSFLRSQWEINDLGPAKFALGIAISRDLDRRTISISQTALIDRVLDQFNQTDAHPVETPMVQGLQLRRPDTSLPISSEVARWTERTPYRSLVGSLMYIAVGTRPDIAYAVGRLSSFVDCFRPEHWEAAIRVLRYLKGTRCLALQLGGTDALHLTGYSDSDYANCLDTSRSIGGYCFTLGSGAISWSSRKQRTVADSSCYAEYIALHEAAHETAFLRQLLAGLHLLPSQSTPVYCDNNAASILTEDHVWHPRVKHVRVKFHYVREQVADGDIRVMRVSSADNTADILTKPLGRVDFQRLRYSLGLRGIGAEER